MHKFRFQNRLSKLPVKLILGAGIVVAGLVFIKSDNPKAQAIIPPCGASSFRAIPTIVEPDVPTRVNFFWSQQGRQYINQARIYQLPNLDTPLWEWVQSNDAPTRPPAHATISILQDTVFELQTDGNCEDNGPQQTTILVSRSPAVCEGDAPYRVTCDCNQRFLGKQCQKFDEGVGIGATALEASRSCRVDCENQYRAFNAGNPGECGQNGQNCLFCGANNYVCSGSPPVVPAGSIIINAELDGQKWPQQDVGQVRIHFDQPGNQLPVSASDVTLDPQKRYSGQPGGAYILFYDDGVGSGPQNAIFKGIKVNGQFHAGNSALGVLESSTTGLKYGDERLAYQTGMDSRRLKGNSRAAYAAGDTSIICATVGYMPTVNDFGKIIKNTVDSEFFLNINLANVPGGVAIDHVLMSDGEVWGNDVATLGRNSFRVQLQTNNQASPGSHELSVFLSNFSESVCDRLRVDVVDSAQTTSTPTVSPTSTITPSPSPAILTFTLVFETPVSLRVEAQLDNAGQNGTIASNWVVQAADRQEAHNTFSWPGASGYQTGYSRGIWQAFKPLDADFISPSLPNAEFDHLEVLDGKDSRLIARTENANENSVIFETGPSEQVLIRYVYKTILPPTVTPLAEPQCILTVDNNAITRGQNTTLRWTTKFATKGEINPGNIRINPVSSGSVNVAPGVTTTYLLDVKDDNNNSGRCSTTVFVSEPIGANIILKPRLENRNFRQGELTAETSLEVVLVKSDAPPTRQQINASYQRFYINSPEMFSAINGEGIVVPITTQEFGTWWIVARTHDPGNVFGLWRIESKRENTIAGDRFQVGPGNTIVYLDYLYLSRDVEWSDVRKQACTQDKRADIRISLNNQRKEFFYQPSSGGGFEQSVLRWGFRRLGASPPGFENENNTQNKVVFNRGSLSPNITTVNAAYFYQTESGLDIRGWNTLELEGTLSSIGMTPGVNDRLAGWQLGSSYANCNLTNIVLSDIPVKNGEKILEINAVKGQPVLPHSFRVQNLTNEQNKEVVAGWQYAVTYRDGANWLRLVPPSSDRCAPPYPGSENERNHTCTKEPAHVFSRYADAHSVAINLNQSVIDALPAGDYRARVDVNGKIYLEFPKPYNVSDQMFSASLDSRKYGNSKDSFQIILHLADSPTGKVNCSPDSQTVKTGSPATLNATGGDGNYRWSAPNGNPNSASYRRFYINSPELFSAINGEGIVVPITTQEFGTWWVVARTQDPCAPVSPRVNVGSQAVFVAQGGNDSYVWAAPGGRPQSGTGNPFSTRYLLPGLKTVTVTSDTRSAQCAVLVNLPIIPIVLPELSCTNLNFTADVQNPQPSGQQLFLDIKRDLLGLRHANLSMEEAGGVPWLSLTAPLNLPSEIRGNTNRTDKAIFKTAQVNAVGLSPGVYRAQVNVTASNVLFSPVGCLVSLLVEDDDSRPQGSAIVINAELDGRPWAGGVRIHFDKAGNGLPTSAAGINVPATYQNQPPETYRFIFDSGGPQAHFRGIKVNGALDPASIQTRFVQGTVTVQSGVMFTLVFESDKPDEERQGDIKILDVVCPSCSESSANIKLTVSFKNVKAPVVLEERRNNQPWAAVIGVPWSSSQTEFSGNLTLARAVGIYQYRLRDRDGVLATTSSIEVDCRSQGYVRVIVENVSDTPVNWIVRNPDGSMLASGRTGANLTAVQQGSFQWSYSPSIIEGYRISGDPPGTIKSRKLCESIEFSVRVNKEDTSTKSCQLSADASHIKLGQSTVLHWQTRNVNSCIASASSLSAQQSVTPPWSGEVALPRGSRPVTPSETATFRLLCDQTVSCQTSINVDKDNGDVRLPRKLRVSDFVCQ